MLLLEMEGEGLVNVTFCAAAATCCTTISLLTAPVCVGDLITFDDVVVPVPGQYIVTNIPDGYHGLDWTNFYILNPTSLGSATNGYYYGLVSPPNVAFNGAGNPAEIDAAGTNFNFLSVYLTAALNSNLNIEVQGFVGTNLVYDETKVVGPFGPTLFMFDYLDIDRLYFNSYGGDNAGFGGNGEQFVMDDFMFDFVPEPPTFLLAALGGLSLVAFLRRTRRA